MNTAPTMRAKMIVNRIEQFATAECLHMNPVPKSSGYPADGTDEDNTFAKFSPSGSLSLMVTNPALLGQIKVGKKFYLDFTEAD